MHGGLSPGAPKGNKNAFKHGRYTAEGGRSGNVISVGCARHKLCRCSE
jgi:hypothetical protein